MRRGSMQYSLWIRATRSRASCTSSAPSPGGVPQHAPAFQLWLSPSGYATMKPWASLVSLSVEISSMREALWSQPWKASTSMVGEPS